MTTHRLSHSATGRLLDAFETANLPNINYQKHFEELAKTPPEGRRIIAWLPDGGGATRELIELHTNDRTARFEIWSPDICLYSHPSDHTAQLVTGLIEACGSALGSEATYFRR